MLAHVATALTISKPTSGQRFSAGPDYATDVLGDPWDFSNPEDIGQDSGETVGFSNFTVNSAARPGLAGGTTTSTDAQISLLYSGRYGVIDPGRSGRKFPINTAKYQKLSYKLSSGLAGELPQLYWFHTAWEQNPADKANRQFGNLILYETVVGFKTWALDLKNPGAGVPWTTDDVRGLRFDPNDKSAGHDVYLDWVRLTAADNAPGAVMQTVQWLSDVGAPVPATIEVCDAGSCAAGSSVLTVATNATSPFSWNYGVLPPGSYQLRLIAGNGGAGNTATVNFTINNPPSIRVTDPNETGGEDFATTVLGNPWDMDSAADIQLNGFENIKNLSFANGVLTATNTNGDPNITLLNNSNNAVPINTSRYRYLTYKMQVDGPFDLGGGSVARVLWDSHAETSGTTSTTTKDIIVWAGMNSYTIDLASLTTAPDGGLEPAEGMPELWSPVPKRFFRLDPHEFVTERTFHIDDVKLAAMAETKNNQFTLRFAGFDGDTQDAPLVKLYYDTDTDPTNGMTLIASNLSLASGQHIWNTTGVPPGVYWIYVEATDGLNTQARYSTGQIRVIGPVTPSGPLDVDASNPSTKYDPLTDGLLILRYMFGLTGVSLTNGAIGPTATRTDPAEIKRYLDSIPAALDIDGNGRIDPLTDGLLIMRYLFGLRSASLIQGAVGTGAARSTAVQIETQLQSLMP